MAEQIPAPQDEYLDADVIIELRDTARQYIKRDFGYLAAGGALIAALKLSNDAIIVVTAELWYVIVAFLALFFIDSAIEDLLSTQWVAAKRKSAKKLLASVLIRITKIQPILHALFIAGVLGYFLGYSQGEVGARATVTAMAQIQNATDSFVELEGRVPSSIDELAKRDARALQAHTVLGNVPIQFNSVTKTRYKIVFPGRDRLFGTPDDWEVSPDVKLKDFIESTKIKQDK